MNETRAGRYGRNLAIWINYTIDTLPEQKREQYKTEFVRELKTYSFVPRKKGDPINSGCNWELTEIVVCNIQEPLNLARLVKESIHLMYQKQTAAKVMASLLDNL